ncbi:hypothetical protein AC579_9875 [Pseudocercospora musae]|uniref:F-box domain-containing protein n=1 Tax=Pseudocercospora musae TaxID=113226 RepID=A0A139I9L0_9PEZI|nr:hypothetical protein AC579_9875 [Pseudocercospora musae]
MAAVLPTPSTLEKSFNSLPAEVLLEVIPYIPYTPHGIACLCLTCERLNVLIKHHEHGLVKNIKLLQLSPIALQLFPNLQTDTFEGLRTLYQRLDTLEELHAHWLKITGTGPELDWLKGRWESIHKAGLLLLYRLQDTGSYCNKVALINALPATSLACLLFKLISSIKILRIYGPDPINGHHQAGDVMARSDIELAFEEMLLHHGPEFFIAMLKAGNIMYSNPKSQWAIAALQSEISGMIDRQTCPGPDGNPRPPTLTSRLRRAFAAQLGIHISQNVGKMWEILSSTNFDEMNDSKSLLKIVQGEALTGGDFLTLYGVFW